jgi:hypothetical protein
LFTQDFVESSVVLDSTNYLLGRLYDWFIFLSAGAPTLGYNGAWGASLTARTATLTRSNGMWTNTATITLRTSSSTTFSIGANQAVYVGTTYGTANGQTGMNFLPAAAAGGNNSILGVFNTYNRVPMKVASRDSTSSWAYALNTWRAANNNSNNAVNFVDGLGEVTTDASYIVASQPTGAVFAIGAVGINLNSTSATPGLQGLGAAASVNTVSNAVAIGIILPALGFNTLNAVENSNAVSTTFFGSGAGTGVGQSQGLVAVVSI